MKTLTRTVGVMHQVTALRLDDVRVLPRAQTAAEAAAAGGVGLQACYN